MLDLKSIRENPADFDAGLRRRNLPPLSAEVLKLDEERRANTKSLQEMQARRNAASKEIGKAKGKGGDPEKAEALMAEVAGLKEQIAAGERRERELDEQIKTLLSGIPNMLASDVPDGKDETRECRVAPLGEPARLQEGRLRAEAAFRDRRSAGADGFRGCGQDFRRAVHGAEGRAGEA